jgi:hypothetical protein
VAGTLKKKQLELQIFGKNTETTYKGRLLGLITQEECAGIFEKPELRNKIMTVETTTLESISDLANVDGFRIALAVKQRDDIDVTKKLLLITEPLKHLSSFISTREVTFVGTDGSYLIATEVDI